jgi:NADPH:quinone reductase-like Zn-dependent oxidoreductase
LGHFAVQIAKHIGAYVIGTSSSKECENYLIWLLLIRQQGINGNKVENFFK